MFEKLKDKLSEKKKLKFLRKYRLNVYENTSVFNEITRRIAKNLHKGMTVTFFLEGHPVEIRKLEDGTVEVIKIEEE